MTKPRSRISDRVDKFPPLLWWILAFAMVLFVWNMARGAECKDGVCPVQQAPRYGWYKIPVVRKTSETGMLGEIVSRTRQYEPDSDKGNWCHETTHFLNSELRNGLLRKAGQDAACMPGGVALILPNTGIPLVSLVSRGTIGVGSYFWSDGTPIDALSLIDEYSAYLNGTIARVEHGYWSGTPQAQMYSTVEGSYQGFVSLERQVKRLRDVCSRRGYPYVKQLDELLAYGDRCIKKHLRRE